MIGYVTLETNDMNCAAAFYDALHSEIGAKRMMESERFIAWPVSPTLPVLGLRHRYDGKPASVGNGVTVAPMVDAKGKVDRTHARALALGARDEGAAGPRGKGFYAGCFRDRDGNKLNVFCAG